MPDIPHLTPMRVGPPTTSGINALARQQERTARDVASAYRPPPRRDAPPDVEQFWAVTWDVGPNGEAAPTNASYWIRRCVPRQTLTKNAQFDTSIEVMSGLDQWVLATNIAELPAANADGTPVTTAVGHGLPIRTRVWVTRHRTRERAAVDDNNPPTPGVDLYTFNPGGSTLPPGGIRGMALMVVDDIGTKTWAFPFCVGGVEDEG